MHKAENSINLGLREKLQTVRGPGFTNKMGAEHLKFITDRAEGGIMPKNSEFMVTGCFKSNCRFSMAHPRV
jgi:hypothetical protein